MKKAWASVVLLASLAVAAQDRLTPASQQTREPIDSAGNNMTADFERLSIPSKMLLSTFRLRTGHGEGGYTVNQHGTAFGIDLSEYGREKPRYLLSAAHCIRAPYEPRSRIEIREDNGKRWVNVRVLAADDRLDICLLECDEDLPHVMPLAPMDRLTVGNRLLLVGCPAGTTPGPYPGYLADKDPDEMKYWQMSVLFFSGCSGGPVFDWERKEVVGVAVAGVDGGRGQMIPNVGLFVPIDAVRNFLTQSIGPVVKKRVEAAPAVAAAAPTNPAVETARPAPVAEKIDPVPPLTGPFEPVYIPTPREMLVDQPAAAPAEVAVAPAPVPTPTPAPATKAQPEQPAPAPAKAAAPVAEAVQKPATPAPSATAQGPAKPVAWLVAQTIASAELRRRAALKAASKPAFFPVPNAKGPDGRDGVYHVVERGEHLTGIAKKYNVKLSALMDANKLRDPNTLWIGKKIFVPMEAPAPVQN